MSDNIRKTSNVARKGIFAISIFALVVRLCYNFLIVGIGTPPASYYGADDGDYDKLGWHLSQGDGYAIQKGQLTANRAPGYPFFLMFIYKIFGHDYGVVRIIQSL
ncbi:MAG: hypothetical protein PHW46_00085, partial [Candidatus Omnitrophica bacterium]|nr:hypothetical protein [Candidatus Omnitrophota bacterium]